MTMGSARPRSSLLRYWEGALGVGLARNVRDIYAFLCRHWAEGDEIFCFGFSRGAFTIRVLTGIIQTQGIITQFDDESDLRRKVAVAYRNFRRKFGEPELLARYIVRLVRNVRDAVLRARDRLFGFSSYPGPPSGVFCPAGSGNATVQIKFVGLWDTVDAYGLPIDEMTRAWDSYIWPLSMRDRRPADCIERAVHLLSIDDERNTFHPLLWDERHKTERASVTRDVNTASIAQVWFSGVHANVGGGYPNDRLSFIPLMFMIDRIDRKKWQHFGLRLDPNKVEEYAALADVDGPQHDFAQRFGGYYRYLPRRLDLLNLLRLQPREWERGIGMIRNEGINPEIPTPLIHETVLQRIEHGSQGYAPIILPSHYEVVVRRSSQGTEGQIRPQTEFVTIDKNPVRRTEQQKLLWNWVWLRRIVYFTTVFLTARLALMPLRDRIESTAGDDPTLASSLSAIPEFLGNFLPGFAKPWIDVYRANPFEFSILALLIAFGLWLGGVLAGTIRDGAQHMWRGGGGRVGFGPEYLDELIYRLRISRPFLSLFLSLKIYYFPLVFALIFGVFGLACVSQLVFTLKEMTNSSCTSTPDDAQVQFANGRAGFDGENHPQLSFDPRRTCWGSGITLEGGRRYRLTVDADKDWADWWIPADLYGLHFDDLGWWKAVAAKDLMFLALPLRRYISGRWFALYRRTSPEGQDIQLLTDSVRPPRRSREDRLHAQFEFTAHRNGELFLFVNDAVPLLLIVDFYGDNKGSAKIGVEQLAWTSGPVDPVNKERG